MAPDPLHLSADASLLLAACDPARDMGDAVSAGPDWTAAVQMALDHGTAGFLSRRLLDMAAGLVPEDLRVSAQAYVDHCRAEHDETVAELLEVMDALAGSGVPALPFKGPAFAAQAHAEPSLRSCLDLDLLIAEAEIEPALAVLDRLGFVSQYPGLTASQRRAYHRYNGHDCLTAPGRRPVEPHWTVAPRTMAAPVDTAGLFARAQPVSLRGREVRTLSVEDALLVAALHGSKEEWRRLIWVADVAGLLRRWPELDAEAVLSRATVAGVRRMVLIGVALATDLLRAPCPPAFAACLARDPVASALARHAAAGLWRGELAPSVFTLSAFRWCMRERRSDRLRYASRTVLTARVKHFEALHLPERLHGLYPLVRLGHDYVALPLWRLARAK
jgi:hypothetical protein